jgi:methionyl-tRNA formyltransferase
MDAGLDTGPMLLKQAVPIGRWTTTSMLTDLLADIGSELVVEAISRLEQGKLPDVPQPKEGITYAAKLDRTEGQIDWCLPAAELDRRVRALNPWPGTFFTIGGERIKLLEASVSVGEGPAGNMLYPAEDGNPIVACGTGALKLITLQRPSRSGQDGASFLRGFALPPGTQLGNA